jgi:hypothetical protein
MASTTRLTRGCAVSERGPRKQLSSFASEFDIEPGGTAKETLDLVPAMPFSRGASGDEQSLRRSAAGVAQRGHHEARRAPGVPLAQRDGCIAHRRVGRVEPNGRHFAVEGLFAIGSILPLPSLRCAARTGGSEEQQKTEKMTRYMVQHVGKCRYQLTVISDQPPAFGG